MSDPVGRGDKHIEAISLAWEAASGMDSISTIERLYDRTPSGAIRCVWPGCSFVRRDPEAMWWHVHDSHPRERGAAVCDLPPADFDYGAYL
jgi:hypothetical protein